MSQSCFVEPLEGRQLLASDFPVVAQQVVGTPEGITAVVLHFSVPLDPTTAQNPLAYGLVKKFRSDSKDGFGGFGEEDADSESERVRVQSATYDAAANTVTLVPQNVFTLRQSFTVIVVRAHGENAVLVPGGEEFDGDGNGRPGGDAILRYKSGVTKRFKYRDHDGDRMTLKVEGPGRMLFFYAKRHRSVPSVFMRESDAATSILMGEVRQGKRGDGIIDIAQISGTSVQNTLTDPPFRVRPLA